MIKMILLTLGVLASVHSSFQAIDCLLTTHVTLQQTSSTMQSGALYDYSIPFASVYEGASNTTLALNGFQVPQSFAYLSYSATTSATNNTATTITVSWLFAESNLTLLQFDLMVTSDSCSPQLQIKSQKVFPTLLSQSVRTAGAESFTFGSSFDLSNSTDFIASVYIQDMNVSITSSSITQFLAVQTVLIEGSRIAVVLRSDHFYLNVYHSITLSLLVVRLSTLDYKHYYHSDYNHFQINAANCQPCSLPVPFTSTQITPSQIPPKHCVSALIIFTIPSIDGSGISGMLSSFTGDQLVLSMDKITYLFTNTSCFITCGSGNEYTNVSGVANCISCGAGCTCDSSSNCTGCLRGYYMTSGACSACSSQCQHCVNTNYNCTSCIRGYYLAGETCLQCDTSCVSCSNSSGNCSACQDGYYLQSNTSICHPCSQNCLSCSSATLCMVCPSSMTLVAGQCVIVATQASTSSEEGLSVMTIGLTAVTVLLIILLLVIIVCWCREKTTPSNRVTHSEQSLAHLSLAGETKGNILFKSTKSCLERQERPKLSH